ncbi:hypothetical protein HDC34_002515 [Pseudoclavibacter sp. JAI123]|uniref:ABC transporter permease n=1 Tax=Pseudoclavibacter sp. JAI123 TaxID=2723065 RepID=UPI0015CB7C39|nr:ABC transporter permease [Pseudoclavibacter sp. JAI123]NYF14188.1 hypothetical protein [Pseudoclavibacter sp. JAI123]
MKMALASESSKLFTLRAVLITLAVSFVVPVLMAAVTAPSVGEGLRVDDPMLAAGTTPEVVGLEWIALGQIGVIIVGVLAGSGEFSGGQIQTSLVAVPNRFRLVLAKVSVLAVTVTLLGAVTIPLLSICSQLGLGSLSVLSDGVPVSLLVRWLGGVVYWTGIALIGFSFAVLVRQALVPLLVLIAVSQISLVLVFLTPWAKFLPTIAGAQLFDAAAVTAANPAAALDPGSAYAVFLLAVVALVCCAAVAFCRRDVRA